MHSPLSDIRVLDFSHLLPGELCSTVLSDLGCQVIRVESLKPGLAQRLPPVISGESLYYWSLHRNKKRLAVDLKTEKGLEIIYKLVPQVDVVLENFRPGVMSRLGVGYGKMRACNKGLIYCSISGYGQNSAFSQRPGHDLNFVAEAGVLSMTAQEDGKPLITGHLVSDYMSATYAALSVVGSLYERKGTGKGRHVDISMFHCALSTLNVLATSLLYTGKETHEDSPSCRNDLANYNVYKCKDDRYLAVASLEPQFWEEFCRRIERPDLASLVPEGPNPQLRQELTRIMQQKSLAEWTDIFHDSNCCVSPINTPKEALQSALTAERNMISFMDHEVLGRVPQLRSPLGIEHMEDEPKAYCSLAGSTALVLSEIGYSAEAIKQLQAEGIVASPELRSIAASQAPT